MMTERGVMRAMKTTMVVNDVFRGKKKKEVMRHGLSISESLTEETTEI